MNKKICFLIDSIFSIGGVQRVTAVIAKELAKEYDITIITFDKPQAIDTSLYGLNETSIEYRFVSYPQVGGIKEKLCKAYSYLYKKYMHKNIVTSNIYAYTSFPSELRQSLTKELNQEYFHVIIGVHAPIASRLATLRKDLPKGTKLIGWIHNSFEALFGEKSKYIGPERKRHYVYQFRKLNATILLCHHDAKTYAQYDPVLRPTVIYNPLTLVPGDCSNGTSKRFLAIGRFSKKHKGFDILIEAFHLFAMKNKEWKLDIVGEGPEEKLYRELISKYQLEQQINLHPFTNNIQEYYSQAQIYVLSSRWEGFGLVLVEAMAHGLPVISSDLPTSQEIMGNFGIYFKNGNSEDLADKLEEATKIDWQQKSNEAIELSKRFNVHTIIKQWKELIEQ